MATKKSTKAPARKRKGAAKSSETSPAYFLSLTVENVRCFGSPAQTLDLSDSNGRPTQWTIILGDNGVGKTTLLRSLVAILPVEHFYYRHDITISYLDESPIEKVTRTPRYAVDFAMRSNWSTFRYALNPILSSYKVRYMTGAKLTERESKGVTREGMMNVERTSTTTTSFTDDEIGDVGCFGYGAARIIDEASLSAEASADPYASLFSDNVALLNAEEWLLRADYAASKSSGMQSYARNRLEQIKKVLLKLLIDVEDVKFSKISRESLKPRAEFKTPYGWVHLQELSLGYRTLIAWMVDFASRMFDRYPDSPNPLAEPAVCLVDEIDLHLHPTWQRKLIGYLTELFPNTQFIVTAHSPLIVQAATDANIVVLRREGDHVVIDNSVESLKGWSVDQILTSDLYGLASERPPEYDDVIAERQRLLAKPELTRNDKRRLRTLEAKVDELPVGDTPQDIKAFDLVRRFAADLESRGMNREAPAGSVTAKKTGAGKARGTKRTTSEKQSTKRRQSKR